MAKALLLSWSSPTSDDATDALDRWYEDTHIPQVKEAVGSVERATRYRVSGSSGESSARFLTVYELADSDVAAANELLMAAARSGRLAATGSMDKVNHPPVLEWYVEHP